MEKVIMRKLPLGVVALLVLTALLVACGDNTATTAPTTTTTVVATTTVAATTTTVAATTTAAPTSSTTAATTATTSASANPYDLKPITTLKDLPADAKKGGRFIQMSLAELAPDLHPYISDGGYTDSWTDAANLIWAAPLVNYNYTTLKWELEAAKDLKVGADNKTFTFTLRPDLKWSDGSPITVDDYQYGYDNAKKPDKDNPQNDYVGINDLQHIVSMTSDKNAATITFVLDQVYPADLAFSTYISVIIPVPTKVWTGKPWYDPTKNTEITKPSVTSGPYMVKSWDPKTEGVLVPNPNWYRGKANFDEMVLRGGNPSVVIESVKAGQIDWAPNIPPQNYEDVKKSPGINMIEWNAVNSGFRYMEYNTKRAPMDDKAFRQALNYAVDRDNLIKLAEAGLGKAQYSFITPDNNYYNKGVKEYKYNLDTAKKTLTEAGYKMEGGKLLDKTGKPVEVTVVYPTSSNPRKLIATYLEQQFKQLGIKVNVDGKEFNAFTKQISAKDFDISLSAIGAGFPDPDSFRERITTGGTGNYSQYSNPQVDDLFKKGQIEVDPAKRKVLYDQAQQIITEDAPVMFLWAYTSFSPMNKKIAGVTPSKHQRLDWNDATARWYLAAS